MNLNVLDWLIVCIPLLGVGWVTWYCNRYMKSVADFLAASRCAGRYLLCVASGEAGYAVISAVAAAEVFSKAGLTMTFWGLLTAQVGLVLGLLGFVVYRFRETRALTLAQFFEIRYNKPVRVASGFLMFVSGIINFGIFPAVSARYFVYYCGFPESLYVAGTSVPTFAVIMVVYLTATLWLTLGGGQLTILVVDAIEGIIAGVGGICVLLLMLSMFPWSHMVETLLNRPPGQSMVNPFDTSKVQDFNIWYVLIGIIVSVYGLRAWQGNQGFYSAARTPHEARMGGVLGSWRSLASGGLGMLGVICALTFLNDPHYADQSVGLHAAINNISNPQIREQMSLPMASAYYMPHGFRGFICLSMIFLLLANSGSYMHSWGSIFIQDVVLPLRKRPLEPHEHISLLRWAIFGVAVFAFFFSLWFQQADFILMFFALTGAIYTAGAGSLIIGGLYWNRGTAAGGITALVVGGSMALGSFALQNQWTNLQPWLLAHLDAGSLHAWIAANGAKCPLNGQWLGLITTLCALTSYVAVSLLTCRQPFDMDRMLHRGIYAVDDCGKPETQPFRLSKLIGFDHNFTRGDKWMAACVFWYGMALSAIALSATFWNFCVRPLPTSWWVAFWHYYVIVIPLLLSITTTIFISVGAALDLRRLFRDLPTLKRDARDDGTVVAHRNLDESPAGKDEVS
jgi:SSS family solute:Na+ symporter